MLLVLYISEDDYNVLIKSFMLYRLSWQMVMLSRQEIVPERVLQGLFFHFFQTVMHIFFLLLTKGISQTNENALIVFTVELS